MTDSTEASAAPGAAPESALPGLSGEPAHVGDQGATRSAATLVTWLQLMRLPTVFTALSNILCGYLITHSMTVAELPGRWDLWLLLCSTFGRSMGGLVLNDVFVAALDAIERPERPIPPAGSHEQLLRGLGRC
jgi:hypothetical protein